MNRIDPRRTAGYDEDFALWSAEQAALLRAGRLDRIDLENVAEEIASLGRSDKREIASRLVVLIAHLLKYRFQPSARSNSWRATILGQRMAIAGLIEDSPSLRAYPGTMIDRQYRLARLEASGETDLPEHTFPETCPWTIAQILDPDFLPE
ncbi:protein of unknown function DUF29 [Devosia enhydra]|uniref:DUF29 domain-containing protein n=1 Tax=Devosia enhydra TaxID=665118 RepID=A0A1K2HVZ3_9HYPH|nr:DUF29 domain-containing protein [Devosia enhydra]SFZ82979.1 protein of unknown function DUF29 [Devosia enhydra]